MNQMEEQQIKNLNEDLMNAMDYKLNRKMIGNLTNLVVLPKDKRKPFWCWHFYENLKQIQ